LPGSLARHSINNRPEAGRIASFLTAVGRQFIASFPCKQQDIAILSLVYQLISLTERG
jgi:hypothetical protein